MSGTSHPKRLSIQHIGIVLDKEIRDHLRDRRSILSAFMSTLIGPVVVVLMVLILGKTIFADQTETKLKLPVVGAENAPGLVQFLEQNGVEIQPGPADPEAEVRNGNADVILVIPDTFGREFEAGRPAGIRVVLDTTRQSSIATIQRALRLIENYNDQMAALRLMARGINPAVINPLAIEQADMATPQSQSLIFLNMMPYFVILVVFVGGMHLIIDATAGERERGSLEPLLINPVARRELVLGKLLASLPFAATHVMFTLAAFAVAFAVIPMEEFTGFQLVINPRAMVGIFLISLPMVLLAGALQMIIASFTRSFKEAQTYVGFLPLVPALPGIGLAFMPVRATIWMMLIPTFGQQLLINQLMRGEPVDPLNVVISASVTLVLSIVLTAIAIRLYERERIIFGTR